MSKSDFLIRRRQLIKLTCGTVVSTALLGCEDQSSDQANDSGGEITVFHNGVVLPVDDEFSEYQAFVVKDNKILALGTNESMLLLAGSPSKSIDLQGRTVLPGFIEPHVHFALMAFTDSWLDMGPLRYESTEQALEALKRLKTDTQRKVRHQGFSPKYLASS